MKRWAVAALAIAWAWPACTSLLGNDFEIVAGVDASAGTAGVGGVGAEGGVAGQGATEGASGSSGVGGAGAGGSGGTDASAGSGGSDSDADVPDGKIGNDGDVDANTCDAAEPTCRICQPGTHRCTDSALEECATDGKSWEPESVCTSAPLCDANSGACLPPVCQPNEHSCSATGELQVCRATQDGFSFVQQCLSQGHCDANNMRCNATTCTNGAYQCSGSRLERCNAGDWQPVQTCASSALCNSGTGSCVTASCAAGQHRCINARLERCKDDLTGWVSMQTCINQALCDAAGSQCRDPVCQTGSHQCSGAELFVCNLELTGYSFKERCASAGHCNAGAGRCDATTCTTGQYQCSANVLQRCNATQSGWENIATCATSALCSVGTMSCIPPQCAAGDYQCLGAALQVCNPGRTGYSTVSTCDSNALCDDTNGQCDVCTPNAYSCQGQSLFRCSTDGQSNPLITNCPAGAACNAQFGRCDSCPATGRGPTMVPLGAFCIDGTEVTNSQYQAFTFSNPSITNQPIRCDWNNSFAASPFSSGEEALPVSGVDWCDASAFCAWSGKRLCGRIGGGPTPTADFDDAAVSQWHSACVSGTAGFVFPYGNAYGAATCNGSETGVGALLPVRSMPGCHSPNAPYSAVFDLSGNADEWEDNCIQQPGNGTNDICRTRGGSYFDTLLTYLRCDGDGGYTRGTHRFGVGFRCCSP
jgi:formylglycine-generating enzyme